MGTISGLDRVTSVSLHVLPVTIDGLAKLAHMPRLDTLTILLLREERKSSKSAAGVV